MAWKPWYDRAAEMDSADEQEEFLKGIFSSPAPSAGQTAGLAMIALLSGWGASQLKKKKK